MNRVIRTDYQAVNARRVVLYTFSDVAKGRAWVRENAHLHDGLALEEVALTARRVYRPPTARRRDPFAIPAFGQAVAG